MPGALIGKKITPAGAITIAVERRMPCAPAKAVDSFGCYARVRSSN